MKTALRLMALSLLLMSFQCHEDDHDFFQNNFKVLITAQSHYTVNDTVWIEGVISSKVFDATINDSIPLDSAPFTSFSVLQLTTPNRDSNAKDALDKFETVSDIGEISFGQLCANADVFLAAKLSSDQRFYRYRVGLKTLNSGDYVFVLGTETQLVNENRNESIIANYPITIHPNQLGLDRCGNLSWLFVDESEHEYYFTVN